MDKNPADTGNAFAFAAPIVLDARTIEGIAPLELTLQALQKQDNVAIAAAEARRLDPYFSAMSAYYSRALEKEDRAEAEKEYLQKLTSKGGLSGLFNAMAARRRNTMISDVAILPSNIGEEGPAKDLFKGFRFDIHYSHRGKSFKFGFLQVFQRDNKNHLKSSVILPTFCIDARMIDCLPEETAKELLGGIQGAMTFINHDMMHHFTMPYINSNIIHNFTGEDGYESATADWMRSDYYLNNGYEEWAHIGYEQILLQPENAQMLEDIGKRVDGFFDALAAVRMKDETLTAQEDLRERHRTIDFYGTLMTHILTRVLPLDHPLISKAINRLEAADPLSQNILAECAQSITRKPDMNNPGKFLRSYAQMAGVGTIAESYKEFGFNIRPHWYEKMRYKHAKFIDLIEICSHNDDIMPHSPPSHYNRYGDLRKKIDKSMIGMIKASATDAKFKP